MLLALVIAFLGLALPVLGLIIEFGGVGCSDAETFSCTSSGQDAVAAVAAAAGPGLAIAALVASLIKSIGKWRFRTAIACLAGQLAAVASLVELARMAN